jgi:hypothetical protein
VSFSWKCICFTFLSRYYSCLSEVTLYSRLYVLPFFPDIILVSLKLHCIRGYMFYLSFQILFLSLWSYTVFEVICFSLFSFFLLFFPSWLIQRLNSSKLKLIFDVVILCLLFLIREDVFKHEGLKSLPRSYGSWIYIYPFDLSQAPWML